LGQHDQLDHLAGRDIDKLPREFHRAHVGDVATPRVHHRCADSGHINSIAAFVIRIGDFAMNRNPPSIGLFQATATPAWGDG